MCDAYVRNLRTSILSVWKDTVAQLHSIDTTGGRWCREETDLAELDRAKTTGNLPLPGPSERKRNKRGTAPPTSTISPEYPLVINPVTLKLHWGIYSEASQVSGVLCTKWKVGALTVCPLAQDAPLPAGSSWCGTCQRMRPPAQTHHQVNEEVESSAGSQSSHLASDMSDWEPDTASSSGDSLGNL